jgi:hypothetical protein
MGECKVQEHDADAYQSSAALTAQPSVLRFMMWAMSILVSSAASIA